jgi:hypothetical protein
LRIEAVRGVVVPLRGAGRRSGGAGSIRFVFGEELGSLGKSISSVTGLAFLGEGGGRHLVIITCRDVMAKIATILLLLLQLKSKPYAPKDKSNKCPKRPTEVRLLLLLLLLLLLRSELYIQTR